MTWNDLPIVCWALSTLICLARRQWIDATWSACFGIFMLMDRYFPTSSPWLRYGFFVAGAALVVSRVMKDDGKYKKSLVDR
ncbi:hypothetical protein LQ564_07970 [Massilia sp. G4R7]|uniref:Uncharacterized protein n=1 Tax=Massilia phyllostachyos TaxID=2898585 RepID=A0ABS8Q3D0_9BURK|nr:hypothetical protein [Massilia phyllostachyos]MCD2516252.1 hypothetical protein [Massilia phyllostachyos]